MTIVRKPQTVRVAAAATALTIALSGAAAAAPLTFEGITFEAGAAAFADSVVAYSPGPNVDSTHGDPTEALGTPDYTSGPGVDFVSLGAGTSAIDDAFLTLRFIDNSLTPSGDSTPDLHIFEVGAAVEAMDISISKNGVDFLFLGTLSGQPTSIDIDAIPGVLPGDLFSFVRISDGAGGSTGSPFAGADIDAVGAISSGSAVVPLPAALPLLASALAGLGLLSRRRHRLSA